MRITLFLLTLITVFPLFSQEDKRIVFSETIYDPFFAGTIVDNEGNSFDITRLSFVDSFGDRNYYFWVRRNSGLYGLSFKNIKKIEISEDDLSDDRYKDYTKATLTLISGVSYEVYIKTRGQIEGVDADFASPVSFYMHYNLIRSIEFSHTGEYSYCPFCETIYFSGDTCIYDKTPLIKGVLEDSEK